jgi:hypothetical protein
MRILSVPGGASSTASAAGTATSEGKEKPLVRAAFEAGPRSNSDLYVSLKTSAQKKNRARRAKEKAEKEKRRQAGSEITQPETLPGSGDALSFEHTQANTPPASGAEWVLSHPVFATCS